jgi:predicted outer membrane repeat protein
LFISDEIEISGVSLLGNIATRGGGAAIGYPLQRSIPDEYTWVNPTYMTFRTTISDTTISTNQSSGVGGGIFAHHGGSISINRTTFSYNSSESSGGGMYQETGDLYITNSTFSGNTAMNGGGLYARGCLTTNPILEIKHSTFAYNVATQAPSQPGDHPYLARRGGGGLNTDGPVRIYNSLVTQNTNKDCVLNQCMTFTITILGNVDSDATCGFSLTETNPMIGPLTWYNSNTATHALLGGSPLIDILSDCAGLTEDQNGILRPQGNNCDPGAYEFNSNSPPPPPPPPPPPIPPPSSRCDLFDNMEISLTLLDIPPATTNQTLYMTFPGGVPGLELEIPNDTAPWVYRATLGSAESIECSFQGYNGRLYCDFVLSERAFGTVQELFAYLDGCDDPIFYHPRVSIFEPDPSCSADLGEEACEAAGGTFLQVSDTQSICTCP